MRLAEILSKYIQSVMNIVKELKKVEDLVKEVGELELCLNYLHDYLSKQTVKVMFVGSSLLVLSHRDMPVKGFDLFQFHEKSVKEMLNTVFNNEAVAEALAKECFMTLGTLVTAIKRIEEEVIKKEQPSL
jgi:hypothetical protein